MYGILVVNEYLKSQKFDDLFKLYDIAAKNKGIRLDKWTNADFLVRLDSLDVESAAFNNGEPEFVLFYDKDIALCRALENRGLRVFNNSDAIRICDSKLLNVLCLAEEVKMPETYAVPFTYENIGIPDDSSFAFLDDIELSLTYPIIIKETYSSFGMGVHLAENRKEAEAIIKKTGNRECIIQEYIETSKGRDIRLQMVGEICVASMMRYNENDFRANLTNGGKMMKYEPNDEQIKMAQTVMKKLKLDFAGIDILFGENDEPVFCEANSNAHFKNLYDLTGINTAEHILEYIAQKIS